MFGDHFSCKIYQGRFYLNTYDAAVVDMNFFLCAEILYRYRLTSLILVTKAYS